jgi:peptide/nickel transport system ATP-binding protein
MAQAAATAARLEAPATRPRADALLEVEDLRTHFFTRDGVVRAVDGVSFRIEAGETLGIVGESGCGKSVTALSILRLIPPTQGRTIAGSVRLEGRDLLDLDERAMRAIRGNRISMIFQEPMTSLNPVLTVGDQIAEAVMIHRGASRKEGLARAVAMLRLVRIPDPDQRAREYPHQLSGGMRQRVMIAIALACDPLLLIADEPTTALDVTVQAQILKLMLELKERFGAAVMLITHDLGVVAETCQRVIVMYAGRKVEEAPVLELFDRPLHPYTRGLMASIPRRRLGLAAPGASKRLSDIPGMVPSLLDVIPGCPFAPRCAFATPRCHAEAPPLVARGPGHQVACWEVDRVAAS